MKPKGRSHSLICFMSILCIVNSQTPTKSPTSAPTKSPTSAPTKSPTSAPTKSPTSAPTKSPTSAPTKSPTSAPTVLPPPADCTIVDTLEFGTGSCPAGWRSSATACFRATSGVGSCSSVLLNNNVNVFNRVRMFIGPTEATGSPDAFRQEGARSIENYPVDGLSVTYGNAGSRQHLWAFAQGLFPDAQCSSFPAGACPSGCSSGTCATGGTASPAYMGNHWSCDNGATAYVAASNCWTGNFAHVHIDATSTAPVEVRACAGQDTANEDIGYTYVKVEKLFCTTAPSVSPTTTPTRAPSQTPTTQTPSTTPTRAPSGTPTVSPTQAPSTTPTRAPSGTPTVSPTQAPSGTPTVNPTQAPSTTPTQAPSAAPTQAPSATPTQSPSRSPTTSPTASPSQTPTQAETGSGKTAAFSVPIVQMMLDPSRSEFIEVVVLVPTAELTTQVSQHLTELCKSVAGQLKVVSLSVGAGSNKTQKRMIREKPSVIVATAARLATHLRNGAIDLSHVKMLVIDEADLILSFGYEDDVKAIVAAIPPARQVVMMSATIGKQEELKQMLLLNDETTVKIAIDAEGKGDDTLRQFSITCVSETDKFLVAYVMIRLRLITGKVLIFVNSVAQGFKLKLFLEQFYLKAALVNAELPQNSRLRVLNDFNSGVYDILIATDENQLILDNASEIAATPEGDAPKKRKKEPKFDAEFGVARGFDFRAVGNVLNFDVPASSDSYVHRIGRTARAGAKGNAISLTASQEDREILQGSEEGVVRPFNFKMDVIEGFRYRVEDVLRQITKKVIRDARLQEIKREMLNSEQLKAHFEDNPRDLTVLQHDKATYKKRKMPQLKHVPDYLTPKASDSASMQREFISAQTTEKSKSKGQRRKVEADPLKTLRTQKRRRKKMPKKRAKK